MSHAAHANAMARVLAEGLAERGLDPVFPVEANAVFVDLPGPSENTLIEAGFGFYDFGDPGARHARFMASFDTQPEDVAALLAVLDRRG